MQLRENRLNMAQNCYRAFAIRVGGEYVMAKHNARKRKAICDSSSDKGYDEQGQRDIQCARQLMAPAGIKAWLGWNKQLYLQFCASFKTRVTHLG